MGTIASFAQLLSFSGSFTKALDLTTPTEVLNISKSQTLANGTGANQANQIWSDTRSVAAAPENLDLAAVLVDAFGDTLTFTKVKMLMVHNKSTTPGEDLTLSGNFVDNDMLGGADSTIVLGPGGICLLTSPVDGFTVTATTGDILTVDPGAATIAYDVLIVGTV